MWHSGRNPHCTVVGNMSPPAEVALRRFNCCADPSSQRCTYRFQSQELFQQIERRSPHTQPIRVQVRFTRRCFITLVVRLLGCHNATKCQRFYSLDGAACSTLYRERCWSTCCCCWRWLLIAVVGRAAPVRAEQLAECSCSCCMHW